MLVRYLNMKVFLELTLILAYAAVFTYFIFKLRDIKNDPHKYNQIQGYEEYAKSDWYWTQYRDYANDAPPAKCVSYQIPYVAAIVAWYVLSTAAYYAVYVPKDAVQFEPMRNMLLLVVGGVLCIAHAYIVTNYLFLHFKKPVYICYSIHHIFKHQSRSTARKRMTVLALVSFAVILPIRLLLLFNIGYFDDERIVYSPALSLHEQVFVYDSLSEEETVYPDAGITPTRYIIENENGDSFDLFGNYSVDLSREEAILAHFPMK